MKYRDHLASNMKTLLDAYCAATGRGPTTTQKRVSADTNFITSAAAGAGFTVGKYDTVVANFAAIWPVDLDWPEGVPKAPSECATVTRTPEDDNGRQGIGSGQAAD